MPHALAIDSRDLALELYALLRMLDPAAWRDSGESTARERLAALQIHLEALREAEWPAPMASLQRGLDDLASRLPDAPPATADGWAGLRSALQPVYEDLSDRLRDWEVHVPQLRPTNYTRAVFHVTNALLTVACAELLLQTYGQRVAIAGIAVAAAWSMEGSRRIWPGVNRLLMALFKPTAHPHERNRVNSATWYATAVLLMALHGSLEVGAAALVILGMADPMAALVGRRFGRHKLVNGRTLEGSLAFFVTGGIGASAALAILHPELGLAGLGIAWAAALTGAIAEALSRYVDDNLSVPLGAAVGGFVALALLV
jgi:dolichol kinase